MHACVDLMMVLQGLKGYVVLDEMEMDLVKRRAVVSVYCLCFDCV